MSAPTTIKYRGHVYKLAAQPHDDPVDIAADLLDHADDVLPLKEVYDHWLHLLSTIKTAKQHNDGIKRSGGGNVSAPDLVLHEVLPTLEAHGHLVTTIAQQLKTLLNKH